jgi:hypothetical protein
VICCAPAGAAASIAATRIQARASAGLRGPGGQAGTPSAIT